MTSLQQRYQLFFLIITRQF